MAPCGIVQSHAALSWSNFILYMPELVVSRGRGLSDLSPNRRPPRAGSRVDGIHTELHSNSRHRFLTCLLIKPIQPVLRSTRPNLEILKIMLNST